MALGCALVAMPGLGRAEEGLPEPEPTTMPAPATVPPIAGPPPAAPAQPAEPAAMPAGDGKGGAGKGGAGGSADIGLLRDALTIYRRGDVAAGDRLRARATDPVAETLMDWAAIRFGGPLIDSVRVLAFMRAHPDWPGLASMRRRAEELVVAERKPPALLRAFFAGERPVTGGGKLALAEAFRADGLAGDAEALVRETWRGDLLSRDLETKVMDSFGSVLTSADHRARMERQLFRQNWEAARRAADLAGKDYGALVKARMAVATKAGNAGKLLDAVPAGLRADTSYLYSRAQFLRRGEKAAEAARLIAGITRDPDILVDGDEWFVERRLIARKLLDDGDAKTAGAVAAGHGAASAERRIEAEFLAGWIALRFGKDTDAAERHFERASGLAATPISLSRTAYWQGRAADAAGRDDEARRFYRRASAQGATYYGQLACARLGLPQPPLRPSVPLSSPARVAAAEAPSVRAIAALYAAGMADIAFPLVVEFAKNSREAIELDAIGDVIRANGDARALLALGKAATQRGLPLDEQAFPTIGVPSFEAAAGPGVERAMVYAIARQESAFDPAAGSPVGARGLMQLMPATAQMTARKVGIEYDPARLTEAAYNARLGAAHLGELMQNWRGSQILTFASYNAGPGNAKKWIDAYGDPRREGVDPVDWVERIPFSETRNYVQRVSENLAVYRKLFEERSALLADGGRAGGAQ